MPLPDPALIRPMRRAFAGVLLLPLLVAGCAPGLAELPPGAAASIESAESANESNLGSPSEFQDAAESTPMI